VKVLHSDYNERETGQEYPNLFSVLKSGACSSLKPRAYQISVVAALMALCDAAPGVDGHFSDSTDERIVWSRGGRSSLFITLHSGVMVYGHHGCTEYTKL
jgi:hypothetical protein